MHSDATWVFSSWTALVPLIAVAPLALLTVPGLSQRRPLTVGIACLMLVGGWCAFLVGLCEGREWPACGCSLTDCREPSVKALSALLAWQESGQPSPELDALLCHP